MFSFVVLGGSADGAAAPASGGAAAVGSGGAGASGGVSATTNTSASSGALAKLASHGCVHRSGMGAVCSHLPQWLAPPSTDHCVSLRESPMLLLRLMMFTLAPPPGSAGAASSLLC